MPTITKDYDFTAGTSAAATEVNANFDELFAWVNTEAIHADGTNAFTALPVGPTSVQPTTAWQLTPKDYVDKRLGYGLGLANGTDISSGIFQTVTGFNEQGTSRHCAVNSDHIEFTTGGIWVVGASINWETDTSGQRNLKMRLDGADFSNVFGDGRSGDLSAGAGNLLELVTMIRPSTGQELSIQALQNSGSTLDFSARFWAFMIAPL